MASREEERGTRAAARTATGARPTRGDLWTAIFEQGREARVRRLWATFGPDNGERHNHTRDARGVDMGDGVVCEKKAGKHVYSIISCFVASVSGSPPPFPTFK